MAHEEIPGMPRHLVVLVVVEQEKLAQRVVEQADRVMQGELIQVVQQGVPVVTQAVAAVQAVLVGPTMVAMVYLGLTVPLIQVAAAVAKVEMHLLATLAQVVQVAVVQVVELILVQVVLQVLTRVQVVVVAPRVTIIQQHLQVATVALVL